MTTCQTARKLDPSLLNNLSNPINPNPRWFACMKVWIHYENSSVEYLAKATQYLQVQSYAFRS